MAPTPGTPRTLRYLSGADVVASMPSVEERIALAERTMIALVADAELPPKIGVHPRQDGSFAHAMPALLRGADPDGRDDRLGIKWVTGFARNTELGIPPINALVILNDPISGLPSVIMDGGPITAQRTAAVSGVAIARFGPTAGALGRTIHAGLIGAGVQGHSHLEVLGHTLPGVALRVFDRVPERAERLAEAGRATPGISDVAVVDSARDAVAGADVVVSVASFTDPEHRQSMSAGWLGPDVLIVPVDYATMLHAEVAAGAALFLVDERGQFLANRDAGQFDGYPDPMATVGEAIIAGTRRPASGRVVVTHLGVGLADVVFGDAISQRAIAAGLGTVIPA